MVKLVGDGDDNIINGGSGSDILVGRGGDDFLGGGGGADFLLGNAGEDTLNGRNGSDVLFGGQDNDILNGGNGGDFLSGDAGSDELTGGGGNDTFFFNVKEGLLGDGVDTVTDFTVGDDVLEIKDGKAAIDRADVTLVDNGADVEVYYDSVLIALVLNQAGADKTDLFGADMVL